MKTTNKLIIFIFSFLALATSAHALTPREQLKQMVQQLQKTPNDNALREKIIKLGASVRPAIPPEAERRMVRGSAAFKSATSAAGYQDAAKEFEQATLAAPWYGDAYFNLGVAQDKAGNHEASLRSLKFAQLASPNSIEIKTLMYEVEFRQEKANSPEARAAREAVSAKEAEARFLASFLASLEGAKYVCVHLHLGGFTHKDTRWEIEIFKGKFYAAAVTVSSGFRGGWAGFRGGLPVQGSVSQWEAHGIHTKITIHDDRLEINQSDSGVAGTGNWTCRRR